MDIFYSIVNFFARGGVFMYPILFVGAVAAAIAIERYVTLTRLSIKNRARMAQHRAGADRRRFRQGARSDCEG